MASDSPSDQTGEDPGRSGRWQVAVAGLSGSGLVLVRRDDTLEIELTGSGHDGGPSADLVSAVVTAVTAIVEDPSTAATAWHLSADHPPGDLDPLPEAVAAAMHLQTRRELLQLRRPLPVPADHPTRDAAPPLVTRPFRPGIDDDAWLEVNNRAFADHPDQGRENHRTLAARMNEDWFDPDGFLVADDPRRPGSLAGFCWTKVHPATDDTDALGEIYVIGVDPSHRGEGLGPTLVLAGLDHLSGRGLATSNLYVESDNQPALSLYDRLGYTVHQRRRVYEP